MFLVTCINWLIIYLINLLCVGFYILRAELNAVEDFWGRFCEKLRKIRKIFLFPSPEFQTVYYPEKVYKILSAAIGFTNKHTTVFENIRNFYFVSSPPCCLDFVQ